MAKHLRNIAYPTVADCVADVEKLRHGYCAGGNWTLEQACFHLTVPVDKLAETTAEPSLEQLKRQEFLSNVIANGWPDATLPSPKEIAPPAEVGPEAIDNFVTSLKLLAQKRDGRVNALIFGPIEMDTLRRFFLVHSAHHLNYFAPATTGS